MEEEQQQGQAQAHAQQQKLNDLYRKAINAYRQYRLLSRKLMDIRAQEEVDAKIQQALKVYRQYKILLRKMETLGLRSKRAMEAGRHAAQRSLIMQRTIITGVAIMFWNYYEEKLEEIIQLQSQIRDITPNNEEQL